MTIHGFVNLYTAVLILILILKNHRANRNYKFVHSMCVMCILRTSWKSSQNFSFPVFTVYHTNSNLIINNVKPPGFATGLGCNSHTFKWSERIHCKFKTINLHFVLGSLSSTLDALMNNFCIKCEMLNLHARVYMLPTKEHLFKFYLPF